MAWDVRQTYYYLVCFATLLMIIIGAVQIVRNALDLALPEEPYAPSPLEVQERLRPRPSDAPDTAYTREELERMAEEEAERFRQQQRRRAIRDLLGSIALVLIATPVYLYHWRQVRRT